MSSAAANDRVLEEASWAAAQIERELENVEAAETDVGPNGVVEQRFNVDVRVEGAARASDPALSEGRAAHRKSTARSFAVW